MSNRYGLTIRATDARDVDRIAEFLGSGWMNLPQDGVAVRLGAVREQPGALLIAEEWGPPIGVIALHWTARLTAALKVAEVTFLLVDPDRRRSGVARLLLKAASQAARTAGCGELTLGVAARQADLQAFALATGFESTGRLLTRSLRKRA